MKGRNAMPLPKIEDYHAPWEVDSTGTVIPEGEQKLDSGRLKRFLHNLLGDKESLEATVITVTAERDGLKQKYDEKTREGEGVEQKQQREREQAINDARAEGGLAALRLEVALDIENITPAQAKRIAGRLTGKDRAALEADAKGLAADFGIGVKPEVVVDDGTPAGRPKRPRASGDPDPEGSDLPNAGDTAAMALAFPRR